MRILIVSHTFPYPPNEGVKLPLYNLIKEFSKTNEVFLISFISEEEKIFVPEIKKYSKWLELIIFVPSQNILKRFYNLFFESIPYNVKQFFSLEFKEKLLSLVKKIDFDIIFFDFLTTAVYSNFIDRKFYKFLHYHDAMSMLFYRNFLSDKNVLRKIYWYFQYKKILSFENKFNNMFIRITVVSEKDKQWLVSKSQIKEDKIEVIPNGVDIEYFKVFKEEEILKFKKEYNISSPSILFRGIMSFRPNIDGCLWFLKNVFPILKKLIPEVKFYIVGPNPTKEILKYKSENIIVKGYVDDLRVYIAGCDVNICPMISGSGIKNKILEALSMGKPSVITTIASEGIPELKDKENVLIADKPEEFALGIKLLLENRNLYEKIAFNGRKLIEQNYTWGKIVSKFVTLWTNLKEMNE
ncbi:MAG: glycosyltransferase family 4 protein [Endomicrobiia bacterium]